MLKDRLRREDGSSPLTRGKPDMSPDERISWRLIPAHAGKTASSGYVRRSYSAHPRSRGENKTPPVA